MESEKNAVTFMRRADVKKNVNCTYIHIALIPSSFFSHFLFPHIK